MTYIRRALILPAEVVDLADEGPFDTFARRKWPATWDEQP